MKRPWLVSLAEGAGSFVRMMLKKRLGDATLMKWLGTWAGHWGRLAIGDEGLR